MGEAAKLTPEEGGLFLRQVMARVAGRVQVIVGVSSPGTDNLVAFARTAMAEGAAGVMVAPLATQRTEEQVIGYVVDVCRKLGDVPVVLQDYPQATGVFLSVATVERILELCPQVVCFKHEDCPGLTKLSRLREGDAHRRRLSILVGNSGLFLPQEMARGADGAMTGFAYPEMLVEVCGALSRRRAGNRRGHLRPLPAAGALRIAAGPRTRDPQGGVAPPRRDPSALVRAPGPKLTPLDHAELGSLMRRLDAKLAARSGGRPAAE